ncbi:MAG: type IV pilus biogenesis/stability protein PilW [Rhodoferax sp.]|nr:type IV pilus biogenesis/stability protein PilW [Rhodoferax sp.]MCW5631639.1 type IV pilus biogenesis/stability protein PilW [Rhodoferax sp.]
MTRWVSGLMLGLTCLLLASCAAPGGSADSGPRADLVTASDEPEARTRARIRLQLAVGYFEQDKTTIALDELKLALAADPTYGDAYNLRGLVYMRLKDLPLAESSFRRALALKPGDADTLHNLGWLMCQQDRHTESMQAFGQALADPAYLGRAKTLMTRGLCQMRAGKPAEAEESLLQSFQLDAGNPITEYNLALLMFQRGDLQRARFYVRRLNNSEWANAESLWLGIKIERRLGNQDAVEQLAVPLRKRFAQSREAGLYERGAFNE